MLTTEQNVLVNLGYSITHLPPELAQLEFDANTTGIVVPILASLALIDEAIYNQTVLDPQVTQLDSIKLDSTKAVNGLTLLGSMKLKYLAAITGIPVVHNRFRGHKYLSLYKPR